MEYLDFLYSGKGNISRIYEVCKTFYRAEKQDRSLTTYFMDFKRTYEELNMLLPFSADVKEQQNQREKMAVMSFLVGLPHEFETAKSQILSSSEISSLQDTFSRVLRTENFPPVGLNSALVSRNNISESGRYQHKNDGKGVGSSNYDKHFDTRGFRGIVCHYCHKPGHMKRDCGKLQNKKPQSAYIASTNGTSEQFVTVPADEYVKFSQYQESLKSSSTPITAIAESGSYDEEDYW
ncbi:uncharacterized protein [Henckelia pumila]|uniref:uncharacterized protein isoform X2 n=1 Tax=Henckelia pumila TaxID=405737 RepID=UPI003C6E8023